jgi:pyruvate carboxylase
MFIAQHHRIECMVDDFDNAVEAMLLYSGDLTRNEKIAILRCFVQIVDAVEARYEKIHKIEALANDVRGNACERSVAAAKAAQMRARRRAS